MDEQVIVTQGEGVPVPKEPEAAKPETKKASPKPLPQETIVGAGVRAQLRAVLDSGPLTEKRVGYMVKVVEQSLPLLRTVMGDTSVMSPGDGPIRAGIKTILGVISLDEWSDAWGYGPGDESRLRRVTTLAKIVFRRTSRRVADAIDGAVATEEAASLDATLRLKIATLLEQPYTPAVAKKLERLLAAIEGLLVALGPAKDRLSPKKRRRFGNLWSGGSGISYGSSGITTYPSVAMPNPTMGPNPMNTSSSALSDLQDTFGQSAADEVASATDAAGSDEDEYDDNPEPLVSSPPIETFGAKLIREIMAMAPVLMNAQRNTPENMVLGIAAAEREGMPKLAAKMRKNMGVEKPEESEIPNPPFFSKLGLKPVELPPAPTPAEQALAGGLMGAAAGLAATEAGLTGAVVEEALSAPVAPKPKALKCSFMFGGFGAECGADAKKVGKNRKGYVESYCDEHHKAGLERGDITGECVGDPSCGVEGTKPGKRWDGLEGLYCDHHYVEALAKGEIVEGSDGHGFYREGECVDCKHKVGAGHGPGCSAVCP